MLAGYRLQTQLLDPVSSHASCSYSACPNLILKTKRNFMDKFVPCFFFHSKLFTILLVIHFFYSKNKKVNALGKLSARANDKPGYFFKRPNI